MENEILTVEELAKYLKISERTVYELLRKGEIPGFKVGATWRFKKNIIDRWIEERANSTFSVSEKRGKR